MPVILAVGIRYIILAATQLGIFAAVEKYALPLLDQGIKEVGMKFGLSEEEATDVSANWFLQTAESVGVFAVTLRTKLPLKVAERLGFTTKGFVRRPLTSKVQQKVGQQSGPIAGLAKLTTQSVDAIAAQVSRSRGLNLASVGTVVKYLAGFIALSNATLYMIAQYIDYGNWNGGAYQDTAQKVLAVITFGLLKPDQKLAKSNILSDDVWKKVYGVYKEQGAVGISDPFKGQTVLFSQEALVSLVDQIASALLYEGEDASAKNVINATTALVIIKPGQKVSTTISSTSAPVSTAPSLAPKVFTGVVSQGTLGAGLSFTARPDDLIESIKELQDAAQNNLAPFLASLPSRVVYEVKVVASITTKDGFTQRGQARQIQTGTKQDGTPKYKTVVNKFATIVLYAITDRGTRAKLTTIVLGPTDAVAFQPSQNDLSTLENALKGSMVTSNVGDISTIVTPQPLAVSQGPKNDLGGSFEPTLPTYPNVPASSQNGVFVVRDGFKGTLYKIVGDFLYTFDATNIMVTRSEASRVGDYGAQTTLAAQRLKALGVDVDSLYKEPFIADISSRYQDRKIGADFYQFFGLKPLPEKPAEAAKLGDRTKAQTLTEYFAANGQELPPISVRSALYEQFGLGQSAYYTGTVEQNTKLLNALKMRDGIPV